MKKITLLLFLVTGYIATIAQVDAPSKRPSERLDSEFFTDNTGDFTESQRITLDNNSGDDSPLLQQYINTLNTVGGGVITVPAGIWLV